MHVRKYLSQWENETKQFSFDPKRIKSNAKSGRSNRIESNHLQLEFRKYTVNPSKETIVKIYRVHKFIRRIKIAKSKKRSKARYNCFCTRMDSHKEPLGICQNKWMTTFWCYSLFCRIHSLVSNFEDNSPAPNDLLDTHVCRTMCHHRFWHTVESWCLHMKCHRKNKSKSKRNAENKSLNFYGFK